MNCQSTSQHHNFFSTHHLSNLSKQLILITTTSVGCLMANTAMAQTTPVIAEGNVNPDFWVATDGLKREIPTVSEVGGRKKNKAVGMFYYILHGGGERATYTVQKDRDVEKTIKANPQNPLLANPNVQKTGNWYWGEPELGYYRSDDPWAIRRNLIMLSNAKVDFIFLDGSNGFPYISRATAIFEEALKMQQSGITVPKIVWMNRGANTPQSQNAAKAVYDFYQTKDKTGKFKYESLWYVYDKKPLILFTQNLIEEGLPPKIKDFFTIKYSWAKVKDAATAPDKWQWLDSYPQTPAWSGTPTNIEQITVSKGEHAHSFTGSSASYVNGVKVQPPLNNFYETPRTGYADYFSQQWSRAHEISPPVVMVTQWNESIGSCFPNQESDPVRGLANIKFLGQPVGKGECGFVDVFNAEFNRDLQPTKNKHSDNDYYLLVNNIRKYKGVDAQPEASPIQPMAIDGNFKKWQTVGPVFMDIKDDTVDRNWPTAMEGIDKYVDTSTGRNDIVASRVMADKNNTYFYVRTDQKITPKTNEDWMELWIDSDKSVDTGFRGYDYAIINGGDTTRVLHRYDSTTKSFRGLANIPVKIVDNQMELSIPTKYLTTNKILDINFKWTDNVPMVPVMTGDEPPHRLFTQGDSAPDRRFNYTYKRDKF